MWRDFVIWGASGIVQTAYNKAIMKAPGTSLHPASSVRDWPLWCTVIRFGAYFIFRGHSTHPHQSPVCDSDPDDLFDFAGPHRNLCLPFLTQATKKKPRERNFELIGSCIRIRKGEKILAVGEACLAIFWPALGLNWRTLNTSGFSKEKTLISASAVPHLHLSLIHIWRCRRNSACRSRWSPYH